MSTYVRVSLLSLFVLACSETSDSSSSSELPSGSSSGSSSDVSPPLEGVWVDSWDGTHEIDADAWFMGESVYHFIAMRADGPDAGWATAQNDEDNAWSAGLFSRFDFLRAPHNGWWFCQTSYDSASEEDARNTPAADPSDPENGGCGPFGWSRLYTPLPIRGDWVDDWEIAHTIREWSWLQDDWVFHILDYDLDGAFIIAQNDADNPWSPGLYSAFYWTEHAGDWWYCQSAYDAVDEQAARQAPVPDATDPSTGGCGVGTWSRLTPPT
jgi:hypothetical protein